MKSIAKRLLERFEKMDKKKVIVVAIQAERIAKTHITLALLNGS